VLDFIAGRLRVLPTEAGNRYDVVEAVIAAQSHDPARTTQAVKELGEWVLRPDWNTILPAYARCVRIVRSAGEQALATEYCLLPETDPAEAALYTAVQEAEQALEGQNSLLASFLVLLPPLVPVINRFFDAVLVMDTNLQVRANRLALMSRIARLANGLADLSKLEGF